MSEFEAGREAATGLPVATYKAIVKRVLETRPSGTRQRLADALGKNRSFISQISNPAYPVPIPAQHIDAIFDVCHFSAEDRRSFLDAYERAHPGRLGAAGTPHRMRRLVLSVPDFDDPRKNRALDDLLAETARRVSRLLEDLDRDT